MEHRAAVDNVSVCAVKSAGTRPTVSMGALADMISAES